MKLIEDVKGYTTTHIIINGDGTFPDLLILERICDIYDGKNKYILYPSTPLKRYSGLSALKNVYLYLDKGYRNFLFIADSEHIKSNANTEIKQELIGIEVIRETQIHDALLYQCKHGNKNFNLYCNFSGAVNCIEEELKTLVEVKLNVNIAVSSIKKDAEWRRELKTAIKNQVHRKELKRVLNDTTKREFESHFSNLCAIFKEIENNYI